MNPFRFINSLRHSFGFGVHSPFAFSLILDTINCMHSYYNYDENRAILNREKLYKKADVKYAELLFRLINRLKAKRILEIGSNCGINALYISASSRLTTITCVEKEDKNIIIANRLIANKTNNITISKGIPKSISAIDALIWNLALYPVQSDELIHTAQGCINEEGFIVLRHINRNSHCRKIWRDVRKMDSLTMSFDLGSIGIGFFKSTLPKLNYDVYFK